MSSDVVGPHPYPKIDTVFVRDDETHKFVEPLAHKRRETELVSEWAATEKLDGTNVRAFVNVMGPMDVRGRTDKATLPAGIERYVRKRIDPEGVRDFFRREEGSFPPVTLYGEGVGPKIQKDGHLYYLAQTFVLFDAKLGAGLLGWLPQDAVTELALALGIPRAPTLDHLVSFDEAVSLVRNGFESDLTVHDQKTGLPLKRTAEGLVLRPRGATLYDARGRRVVAKLKTKDFA